VIRWDAPRGEAQEQTEAPRPVVNVLVREIAALESFLPAGVRDDAQPAVVHRLPGAAEGEGEHLDGEQVAGLKAVAPPIQSFAMGRRR
jgi:hypothetical protein